MKRSAAATMRRTVRRGLTWRAKREGDTVVDIAELVSPLRYDVVIRAEFFTWLAGDAAGRGDAEVAEGALDLPYFYWFEHVAMARFRPWVLKDRDLLRSQFTERVVSGRRLAESIAENGFDRRSPITLRATRGVSVADSGARLSKTRHVGDGGHRTALLLSTGRDLEPWMYVVDPRPMPVLDNTRILNAGLGLGEREYTRFLSREFAPTAMDDLASLRAYVDATTPHRLPELHSVLAAHGRSGSAVTDHAPTTETR